MAEGIERPNSNEWHHPVNELKHGYVYQDQVNGGFIIEIFRGDKSEKKMSVHTLSIQDEIITAQVPEDIQPCNADHAEKK